MRNVLGVLVGTAGDPLVFGGTAWDHALAFTAGALTRAGRPAGALLRCSGLSRDPGGRVVLAIPAYDGKLIRKEPVRDGAAFVSFLDGAELPPAAAAAAAGFRAAAIGLALAPAWVEPPAPPPAPSLERAGVIIDIGYGIRDAAGMVLAKELKTALEQLGLAPVFGATRKVTQDLKLLPLDDQIGQTGVRADPELVIALGISGAPQHIDYLGIRADILCFNKDPEAPLMKLNASRPAPRVHPVAGDLFVTVRELLNLLRSSP
jgi:electron transfer flavoprotein alpha subunit